MFGHIMRKHPLILWKKFYIRIMRKFKQFIKLIIRPVQCIKCFIMINQDSKLRPIQSHLRLKFFPLWLKYVRSGQFATSLHGWNTCKRASSWHFATTFAKINKLLIFVSHHEFCFNLEICSKIVLNVIWLDCDPFPGSLTIFSGFCTHVLQAPIFPTIINKILFDLRL